MFKHDPTDLKPCKHMETLVSSMVDGNLKGLPLLYTKSHVKGCAKCAASIPHLGKLKDRVCELGNQEDNTIMPPERWSNVEEGWDKTDMEAGHSHS